MSLSTILHRHHTTSAPVTAIPDLVWMERWAHPAKLHRSEPDAALLVCELQHWPFWQVPPADTLRLHPEWCATCWPGRRCNLPGCGLPSGADLECPTHTRQFIATDKAIERSA